MDIVDPDQRTQCTPPNDPSTCKPLYHQPGATKGLAAQLNVTSGRSCAVVKRLMRADVSDMKRSTFKARCPRSMSKIALVVHPGEDYHFYREDDDGLWSHKDGSNPVKRYDADGNLIWNPRTAARDYRKNGSYLNYKDFCGFWCVPRRRTIKLSR